MLLAINLTSIDLIVWSICAGACLAFAINHVYKRLLGSFVRTLIAYDHISPDSAATLDELGLNNKKTRFLLRDSSPVMAYVSVVGDSIPKTESGKNDYESARFYVTADKKEKALCAFAEPEKLIVLFLVLALIIGCGFALTKLVPILIGLLG